MGGGYVIHRRSSTLCLLTKVGHHHDSRIRYLYFELNIPNVAYKYRQYFLYRRCSSELWANRQGTLPRFGGTPLIVYDTLLVLDCLLLYLRRLHLPHATSVGRHCRNRLLQVRHSLFLHDSGDILARQKEAVSLAESFR